MLNETKRLETQKNGTKILKKTENLKFQLCDIMNSRIKDFEISEKWY